jgi:hypothetical protein
MTTDTRRGIAAALSIPAFLVAIFLTVTVEDVILIGECGYGPAAPTSCEWDDLDDPPTPSPSPAPTPHPQED